MSKFENPSSYLSPQEEGGAFTDSMAATEEKRIDYVEDNIEMTTIPVGCVGIAKSDSGYKMVIEKDVEEPEGVLTLEAQEKIKRELSAQFEKIERQYSELIKAVGTKDMYESIKGLCKVHVESHKVAKDMQNENLYKFGSVSKAPRSKELKLASREVYAKEHCNMISKPLDFKNDKNRHKYGKSDTQTSGCQSSGSLTRRRSSRGSRGRMESLELLHHNTHSRFSRHSSLSTTVSSSLYSGSPATMSQEDLVIDNLLNLSPIFAEDYPLEVGKALEDCFNLWPKDHPLSKWQHENVMHFRQTVFSTITIGFTFGLNLSSYLYYCSIY